MNELNIDKITEEFIYLMKINDKIIKKKAYDFIENSIYSNKKIVELNKELDQKYKINVYYEDYINDCIQYMFLILLKKINLNYKDFEFKLSDKIDDLEERMMFRLELYKNGWSLLQIEKYMYKYFYKKNIKITEDGLDILNYITNYFNLQSKNITKRKGRPSLPECLRNYKKEKHINNIKNKMKIIYKQSKGFNKIKDNLLSNDEINCIKNLIKNDNKQDINIKNKILIKIENLIE
jgi:hypothetical protein